MLPTVLFGVFAVYLFPVVMELYHDWRVHRFVVEAEASLKREDAYALNIVRSTLIEQYPDRLETLLFLAKLGDRYQDGSSIYWRRRILAQLPESDAHRLALGLNLLEYKRYRQVGAVLKNWPAAQKDTVSHLKLKSAYAFATHQDAVALNCNQRIYEREPTAAHLVNLANSELSSGTLDTQQRGETRLRQHLREFPANMEAHLSLIRFFIRMGRVEQAASQTNRAWKYLSDSWQARFALLEAAAMLQSPNLDAWRSETVDRLPPQGAERIQYGSWLLANIGADACIAWFESQFAPSQRQQFACGLPYTEALIRTQAFAKVLNLLNRSDWGNNDYLRLVAIARVSQQQGVEARWWKSFWDNGVETALAQGSHYHLLQTLQLWGWTAFEQKLLLVLRDKYPQDFYVYARLNAIFEDTHDERGLWENAAKEWQAFPQNLFAKNNFIYLSTLLGKQTEQPLIWAQENLQANPQNPYFRATYAYALVADSPQKALQVLDAMEPYPASDAIAIIRAWVLSKNGYHQAARQILTEVEDTDLLPAERDLKQQILAL